MQIVAQQKNTRQSPRKVRLVANAVKKFPLREALEQLTLIERRASIVILKVMRQALANAEHNHNLKFDDLELKNILVNPGSTYKRFRAVSRGRAHNIFKRTCHVKVILESKAAEASKVKKVKKDSEKDQAKVKSTLSKKEQKIAEAAKQRELKAETGQTAKPGLRKKGAAPAMSVRSQAKSTRTKNLGGRN